MTAKTDWTENLIRYKSPEDLQALLTQVETLHKTTQTAVETGIAEDATYATVERDHLIATALECYGDIIAEAIADHPRALLPPETV